MKKYCKCAGGYLNQLYSWKIFKFMRNTLLLIFITVLQAHASDSYSQKTKLTLNLNDVTVSQVLEEIQNTSEFNFLFNAKLVDVERKVSISMEDTKLSEILASLFSGTGVNYLIYDKQIILTPSDVKPISEALQQQRITGTVVGKDGAPIPGVNVVVTGTTLGTLTDVSGKYSIEIPKGSKSLTFSFIGMGNQVIVLGALTQINVTMIDEAMGLEEVVIVGYGTQKRSAVVGSIVSIKKDEIQSITTPNIVTGLAGKLPGLTVTQRTGEPGSYTTVFDIRGFGNPLVVVDGIVREDFTRFDPNDIENISVLKDATAAVYGIKAANGVILITTKKGNISKPVVTYSAGYDFVTPIQLPKSLSSSEWATLTTEYEINSGKAPGATTFTAADIQKYADGSDPLNYPNTNWLKVISHKYTTINRHNINIEGGTERIKYFTSLGYMYESGVWKSNDLNYRKYNVRSSITSKLTNNLTAQLNIDAILEKKNEPKYQAWNVYLTALNVYPNLPVYANNNPNYLQDVTYPNNPLGDSDADYTGYIRNNKQTFQGNFSLNYNVAAIQGLSAKAMFGYFTTNNFTKTYFKLCPEYTYDKTTGTYNVANVQNDPASLRGDYYPFLRTTLLGQISYDKVFSEKHNLSASLIFEERHEKSDNMYALKEFSIGVDQFFAGVSANSVVNSSNIYENRNQNVIGKLNYIYASKYIFESGFNYGGSSKFPTGSRWGFFPYVSAGWRISEENFIKNNISIVNNLKLRASWGQMGDDGASTYQFLTGYDYPVGNYVFNDKVVGGLGFRGMPNPNITWFTVTTKNIGFDLGLLKDLISVEFDLFRRDRSGLLATRVLTIPGTVGAGLPQENLNSDMRQGFELVIGHRNTIGELTYKVSASMTYSRGQFTNVERSPDGNSYLNWRNNITDRWTNIAWGYKYIGQFQSKEEALSSPTQDNQGNRTLNPGSLKYEDVNRDGMINSLDQVPIGRGGFPDAIFALNVSMAWKNLDLSIFAQGASRYDYTYTSPLYNTPLQWGRNSMKEFMDRWHHEDLYDANSPWVAGYYPSTGYLPSDKYVSRFWRQDASYLRLKNIEIGYTLKNAFLERASIQKIRFSLSGFNLFTLTKIKYVDPEQDPNGWGNWYPISRTVNFGLNVTF
jgi:TonB-linked SusC/RagA family outer membrane protein